ncbi:MAG TPA: hypothetical protein VNA68_01135 [Candidatus Dormibacteraeota bacterium]|nr:hypothetical protein [Candidatus Dormibacteraeota bacterium]
MQLLKQSDKPLFGDILWNKPLSRSGSGRLLIVGGHKSQFNICQNAYMAAVAAGIGECNLIMPDSLYSLLKHAPHITFVPSNASGALGKAALADILEQVSGCDGIMLPGNLSTNSETTTLIESLIRETGKPLILGAEALRSIAFNLKLATARPKTLVAAEMPGIFDFANSLKVAVSFKHQDSILNMSDLFEKLMDETNCDYLSWSGAGLIAAASKQCSLSAIAGELPPGWYEGAATVFWLQYQSQPFEALTTAGFILAQAAGEIKTDNPPSAEIEQALRWAIKTYS